MVGPVVEKPPRFTGADIERRVAGSAALDGCRRPDGALVSPTWFQSVAGVEGPQHAGTATAGPPRTLRLRRPGQRRRDHRQSNLYDWIVQFNTAAAAGISSVADTASLLVGGGINFQVIEGLGLVGEVLVRSSGASLGTVENWLSADAIHEHVRARRRQPIQHRRGHHR